MDKNYNHQDQEDKIYKKWEESGVFSPPSGDSLKENRKTFTIIMPPPNANDPLHAGHAMFVSVEDILVRYHRLLGEATLWIPGTDHAGIETQFVFEKKLNKEGKSRFDFDRATLYEMIWDYVQENSKTAISQMKKLGASADWSRYKFTLDPEIVKQVLETFVKLHKDGLVYKGVKLVNYCTKCGTAYSDLEVNHEEKADKLYSIKYGDIVVATTRPETLLGDVAVAVNPTDKRYLNLIGKTVTLPLVNREIPVIADSIVDLEFGTGAVKVTPSHDQNDWDMAERAGMDLSDIVSKYQIIGQNGKLTKAAGKYEGLNVNDAREKIIEDLGDLVVDTLPYSHNVGTCYRCHRTIEPLPMSQFFIKTKPLAKMTLAAIDNKETRILGAGREKILKHWLKNIKDWNISRQIVWGIQIPVWYKDKANNPDDYIVSVDSPGEGWTQETDTFDTWFSSGQWPVVTLKSAKSGDFDKYYPTNVMETGYDILPFWVMRMMMLSIYLTGKSPFKYVYLHGLVRDSQGRKMSKSIGNVVNPIEYIQKYGTDALRMALVMSTVPGMDSNTGDDKVRGMRNFGNKIWNAGRYVYELSKKQDISDSSNNDDEFNDRLTSVASEISTLLDKLKIGLAAETIYNEFWHWFCDESIEANKKGLVSDKTLIDGYKKLLILLHPFVPFVTESAWEVVFSGEDMLINSRWPRKS